MASFLMNCGDILKLKMNKYGIPVSAGKGAQFMPLFIA